MSYICDCEAAIISFAEAFIAAMYGAWPYIIFMISQYSGYPSGKRKYF